MCKNRGLAAGTLPAIPTVQILLIFGKNDDKMLFAGEGMAKESQMRSRDDLKL
jgi:hypothetical protein